MIKIVDLTPPYTSSKTRNKNVKLHKSLKGTCFYCFVRRWKNKWGPSLQRRYDDNTIEVPARCVRPNVLERSDPHIPGSAVVCS